MKLSKHDGKIQRKWPLVFLVSTFVFLTGCVNYAAGNFSSLNEKIVWTSNSGEQTVPLINGIETFNIFRMDADGGNRIQLTNDAWPIINQHPVFTSDGAQIVWLRENSLWIMSLNGSGKTQLTTPAINEADGHPWVGADGYVYFTRVLVRLQPPFESHRIWRMKLDGANQVEIIGGRDKDRFHPNLHRDKNQVVYTAGPPGSGVGAEIRVFNLSTGEDELVIGPGAFSAAILHPLGKKLVLAQNPDGNQNYEIAEYEFPSGSFIRTIVNDNRNNNTPYFDYPAGSRIIWVGQPDRASQRRRTRHIWLKASEPRALTSGPFENTQIVGEITIDPQSNRCVPRPVGCFPTPPPCQQVLLPRNTSDDAELLGRTTARAHKEKSTEQNIRSEGYRSFMDEDLDLYLGGNGSHVTEELQKRAQILFGYLTEASDDTFRERVADFYVNSYFAELSNGGGE